MKQFLSALILAILFLLPCKPTSAFTAAGGEIIYVHIADSTYQYFIKLYNDCAGGTEPATMPLCFQQACTNQSFSITAQKWTGTLPNGGPIIGPICNSLKTNCDSVGSPVSAIKEVWYMAIATLPLRCNWKIYTYVAGRSSLLNISNAASTSLYLEATMNNTIAHANSSPYYSVRPPYAVPVNRGFSYNAGAIDADGDSLWTQMIMPLAGGSTCADTATNVIFNAATPAFNLVTNPFQTNNSFYLSGQNGQMSFTSTQLGKTTIALRTREYRNGVLIGSTMREMQIQTLQIPVREPRLDTIGLHASTQFSNGVAYGCAGSQLSLSFPIKSDDSTSKLYCSDNTNTALSAAAINYTNQGHDSVYVTFTWTPTLADVGKKSIIILIADSGCTNNGIVFQYAKILEFWVWSKTKAPPDTSICAGNYVFLDVSGGGSYQWKELPGGNVSTSVSNPYIANPVAFPAKSTIYQVVSSINPYCPALDKDTVVITVRPATTGANAIATGLSCGHSSTVNYINTCAGQPISFCFNTSSSDTNARLYHFNNAASIMPGAMVSYTNQGGYNTAGTFSWSPQPYHTGFYPLVLSTYDSACSKGGFSHLKEQHIGIMIWPKTKTIEDKHICPGDQVQLSASGGVNYLWTILPGGDTNSLSSRSVYNPVARPDSTTTYIVTAPDNIYCGNNTDTVTVSVYPASAISHPSVAVSVTPSANVQYGTWAAFTATATACNNPYYIWYKNGHAIPGANGPAYHIYSSEDMQQYWCRLDCADSCATPRDTISNKITMRVTVGVHEIPEDEISVYPNPNNGRFTLQLPVTESYDISISNALGQVVYSASALRGTQPVVTGQLPPGLYMLKAANAKDQHLLKIQVSD